MSLDTLIETTDDFFVQTLLTKYRDLANQIEEIDDKLDDSVAGTKTKLLNQAAIDAGDSATRLVESVTNYVTDFEDDPKTYAGVVTALRKALTKLVDKADAWAKANVPAKDETSPTVSDEERKELLAVRKSAVDGTQSINSLLASTNPKWFEANNDELPTFKNRRDFGTGTRGKLGPRLVGKYEWSVDGAPPMQDGMNGVVKTYFPAGTKVKDLRAAVEASNEGFDWTNPPESFSTTFLNKKVVATRVDADDDDDADDMDDIVDSLDDESDEDDFLN